MRYNFQDEATRVCEAIGSGNGNMTVQCALREAFEAGQRQQPQPSGAELIAEKVRTNREHKGYTAEHDDEHHHGELAYAGAVYARVAGAMALGAQANEFDASFVIREEMWPFEAEAWKPSDDPIRNLVHAGALIAAEIDRLNRARAKEAL